MNKKGAVAIGIIVVLVLGLYSFLFFKIITNSMVVKNNLNPVLYSGHVYATHEGVENSLYLIAIGVFIDSYQRALAHNSKIIGFDDADLNERFRAMENYQMGLIVLDAKNIPDAKQNNFTKLLIDDSFGIDFDGDYSSFFLHPLDSKISFGGSDFIVAEYSSPVKAMVGFDMLGLPSFDKIKNIHESCSANEDSNEIEKCISNGFSGFIVSLLEEKDSSDCLYNIITFNLVSVDKYYVLDKMQSINFDLVFNIDLTEDEKIECNRKKSNLILAH